MAKPLDNQSPHYEEIKGLAAANIAAGVLQTIGQANVFPMVDVLDTENYAGVVKSAKVLAAKEVGALVPGEALYYVTASNTVQKTSGDVLIGFVNKAAASADTHVDMRFDGTLAFAKL